MKVPKPKSLAVPTLWWNFGDIGQTIQTIETESTVEDKKYEDDVSLSPIKIHSGRPDDSTIEWEVEKYGLETKFSEPSLIPDESDHEYDKEIIIEEPT